MHGVVRTARIGLSVSVAAWLVGCTPLNFEDDAAVNMEAGADSSVRDASDQDPSMDAGIDGSSAPADASDGSLGDGSPGLNMDATPQGPGDGETQKPVEGGTDGGDLAVTSGRLAVGSTHACAARGSDRTVYCWGNNDQGQLGVVGELADFRVPVKANGDDVPVTHVQQLALGRSFSCALRDDGRVVCWGARDAYQTGTRRTGFTHKPYPVVLASGGVPPEYLPLENIVQIVAGDAHACAVDVHGKLFCWGSNAAAQLGVGVSPSVSNGAVAVTLPEGQTTRIAAASLYTTCVVTNQQRLYCWGFNEMGNTGTFPEVDDAGTPTNGVTAVPHELTLETDAKPIKQLRGGGEHFVLLAENGSIWTWGSNFASQLERNSPICKGLYPPCDPVPGVVTVPGGQVAATIGSTATYLCAVLGPARPVWCGRKGFVMTAESDASAPLEDVKDVEGSTLSDVSCALTNQDDIYCHGGFRIGASNDESVVSPFGVAVQISFPE